jgi:hypothetical protein
LYEEGIMQMLYVQIYEAMCRLIDVNQYELLGSESNAMVELLKKEIAKSEKWK